jgi:hypothetical protein
VGIRADIDPVTGLADDLRGELVADMLDAAAYAVKRDALPIADAVTGGDRRLSRFGASTKSRGRTRMGVNYTVTGRSAVVNLKPAAMWALTTGGARPHLLGAGRRMRSGKYRRGRGPAAGLVVFPAAASSGAGRKPSRVRTGPIRHPGARGRGALAAVYARVPAVVGEAFDDMLSGRLEVRRRG